MNKPRLALLLSSVLLLPTALLAGVAGPAAAGPPSTTFGFHVSSCAQMSSGFTGQHNRATTAAPDATHDMNDMHC